MIKRALFSVPVVVLLYVLTGCENSLIDRSLIFATHTTLGVELSVTPSETSGPVNIIMGYKRTEGVLNPVYHSQGIETPDKETKTLSKEGTNKVITTGRRPRYRDESYSVIAKFTGETTGSANKIASTGMSVAQWFATGEAAKTLANQPGIAGAVTGSSEIANAAAKQSLKTSEGESKAIQRATLSMIYEWLKAQPDENAIASTYVDELDKLATLAPELYPFTMYTLDTNDLQDKTYMPAKGFEILDPVKGTGFTKFTSYWAAIDNALEELDGMAKMSDVKLKGKEHVSSDALVEHLKQQQEMLQIVKENFEKRIGTDTSISSAVEYFLDVSFPKTKE